MRITPDGLGAPGCAPTLTLPRGGRGFVGRGAILGRNWVVGGGLVCIFVNLVYYTAGADAGVGALRVGFFRGLCLMLGVAKCERLR